MDITKNLIFEDKKAKRPSVKKDATNQVILTTRSRIARNLSGYRFSGLNTNDDKKNILDTVKKSFFKPGYDKDFIFYNIVKLSRTQRRVLLEKHLLSPEMLSRLYAKGLILKFNLSNPEESVSIMINEEDHLRIQSIMPGLCINKTYSEIVKVEKILEKDIRFAYDRDFGYLTSCPTNIGTGLRISVMAHLPALVLSGKIEDFVKRLSKIKMSIRGFFGENSDVAGNLFQVANQVSTGKYEKDILDEMNAVCMNIIDEEKKAIQDLRKTMPLIVEDSAFRAFGMIKYAKMLSYGESLELLSMLKISGELGLLLDAIKPFDFYQLISLLGESNIILAQNMANGTAGDEIDKIRADILRKELLK